MANLSVLGATATVHGPLLSPINEKDIQLQLDVPCKNVDLQSGARWACSSGFFETSPDSGYRAVSFDSDVEFMRALQVVIKPAIPHPAYDSNGKSGWFFSMPDAPKPPPDNDSRQMMKTEWMPFGEVINLNPCCFGEVYWVGGIVGGDYIVLVVWIPYSHWVTGPLPILFHFRPAYNDCIYDEARAAARDERVPVVFGALSQSLCDKNKPLRKPQDNSLHQPFLDSAWYYLLGQMSFVQQMQAAQRLAILVMMIPPTSGGPDAFFTQFDNLVTEAVDKAVERAVDVGAGPLTVSKEGFILTANSFGGTYLSRAANNLTKEQLRELWMFDCTNMKEGWNITQAVRRFCIAQAGNRRNFFDGRGHPWDREGNDWSIVDVSRVPDHGDNSTIFVGDSAFPTLAH